MKLIIDPPNGWKYGFPKTFDTYRDPPLRQWLVEQGCPQSEIDAAGANFTIRTMGGSTKEFIPGLPTSI